MEHNKKVTLRDIAKAAGVSPSTISLVLNNKGNLPEERRTEIRNLAAQMGYTPNPMARALKGGSTRCIGLIINYFNNPYYRSLIAGLETGVEENGYYYSATQHRDSLEREQKLVHHMAEHGHDGLIVVPCGNEGGHFANVMKTYNIPVVLTSHVIEGFAGVEADNVRGAAMLAEHILSLDRPTNIILAGRLQKSATITRERVFGEVLKAHDPKFDPAQHVYYTKNLTADGGFRVMGAIAVEHKPPYSVFAVNDEIALGVLRYCRQHRLRVPEDVAVAGFSDIDVLEDYGIPLTTVRIPVRRIGENAVELLLEMKRSQRVYEAPPIITLPVSLVIRGSTIGLRNDAEFTSP